LKPCILGIGRAYTAAKTQCKNEIQKRKAKTPLKIGRVKGSFDENDQILTEQTRQIIKGAIFL
jgi:hypothetical protein